MNNPSGSRNFAAAFRVWLPVLLWMAVIFTASTDAGSVQHSSRILVPILRWFNPEITPEAIHIVQIIVRKGAHLAVYALLAMLTWRSWRLWRGNLRFWSWREAGAVLLLCAGYAITDEFHQSFVSTRQGSFWDVLIDIGGASLGIIFTWFLGKIARDW